ncbi:hypothetical protein [Flavobacterium sp. FlaQc-50]|uniref:hypothetical protein n=1 Tax=unclassified Flavobacterium TaxID=196869 RepID=UPI0037582DD5
MVNLTQPNNVQAAVLYTLIQKGKVSIEDFPHLSGFRTRVSEINLQHEISMQSFNKKGKNQFGRIITYVEHHIDPTEVEKAIQVYKTINK